MESTPERLFALGDILSVTLGRLVSPRHIDGVYDILSYMTHSKLYTHQLPKAMKICAPFLVARYPQLTRTARHAELQDLQTMLAAAAPSRKNALVAEWVAALVPLYGAALPVPHYPDLAAHFDTPTADLLEIVRPDQDVHIVELPPMDGDEAG